MDDEFKVCKRMTSESVIDTATRHNKNVNETVVNGYNKKINNAK